jgi:AcrR family transcriptional regulator
LDSKIGNSRRQPAQERSKKRVESILGAARALIAEKGSARLKIHEIAHRAGVTAASIYQYFPSKNSIAHELARQALEDSLFRMRDNLAAAGSREKVFEAVRNLVEQWYQMRVSDPALMDVMLSVSSDKAMQDIELAYSRQMSERIFEMLKPFYDDMHWSALSEVAFLLAHLALTTVRMALSVGRAEGRSLMDRFEILISAEHVDSMLNLTGVVRA